MLSILFLLGGRGSELECGRKQLNSFQHLAPSGLVDKSVVLVSSSALFEIHSGNQNANWEFPSKRRFIAEKT